MTNYALKDLGGGFFTKVDLDDLHEKMCHLTCVCRDSRTGYCYVLCPTRGKTSLHRLLLDPPKGKQVDHINGDRLDNRRFNLRICSKTENSFNIATRKGTISGHKGVTRTPKGKWQAYVTAYKIKHYLGTFETKEEAISAREAGAQKYHGEFYSKR